MQEIIPRNLIVLHTYREEHIHPLREAVLTSIPELPRHETWAHTAYTLEEAEDFVTWWRRAQESGQAYYFAVEASETGLLLGRCGLSDLVMDHRRASLGFWIRQDYTSRGCATDAARALLTWGFQELGLNRKELEIAVGNAASRRVAEKLGAVFEDVL
ncbi:MAG: GNAT family N-acetyltransferase [Anaerolineales bacterium]|nr:GNAT family N-acetyltransferase [Anaerolineales bacterium]